MEYGSSNSGEPEMKFSNVISLHGHQPAVSPSLAPMPAAEPEAHMPDGYSAGPNGVYFHDLEDGCEEDPVWICSPIAIAGLCRRPSGKGWSRVVDVVDPDDRTHRLLLDEALFNGSPAALLNPLLDCGLRIGNSAVARKHVADLLGGWRPHGSFLRVSRVGWVDNDFDTFVFADGTIVGRKKAILERDTGIVGEMAGVTGSLETWQKTIAASCVGNPLLLLAVSQAFVGPLLQPLGLDGGGFHFRGASSRGKTTLLKLAASAWGSPDYVQSWHTTDNAIENVPSSCSSALLALDELHHVEAKDAGEIVYILANGRGKQRMSAGGKTRPTDTWHAATLSSGEITLEEHMASGGKRIHAGQDVRLIDIEADGRRYGSFDTLHGAMDSGRFIEKLLGMATTNHGHAGRIFVEKLIKNMDRRDSMKRLMNNFVETTIKSNDIESDGQVRRVLRRFAVAAVAGEMATKAELTGWETGEATKGIREVARVWLEERDVAKASEVASAMEATRSYLTMNSHRFLPCGSTGDVDGWRDDAWFYIRSETWSRIHGEEGAQDAARLHKAANMLRTNKGETLQYRMGRSTPDRPKVYAVSVEVLET